MNGPARLWRVPLRTDAGLWTVVRALAGRPGAFALTGGWAGGGAILGSDPLKVADPALDPFSFLDDLPRPAGGESARGAVGGGWFGWLGYGAGARVEALPPQPPRPHPLPVSHLAYYDSLLRLDRAGRWWFEALVTPAREAALDLRRREMERLLGSEATGQGDRPQFTPPGEFRPAGPGDAGHLAAVARCRQRIAAGEFFQANLRVRFEAGWEGDLATLFAVAAERVKPAYGALFVTSDGGIASLSPELFLRRYGNEVVTGPIKGTAPRPDDPTRAESFRQALLDSGKDAAEHVMIVDVARNDLGRVCSYGTVEAPVTPEAQAHPGVWHLVSQVRGRLVPETTDGTLLRATFPPCSVTGAPKIQAMRAIGSLESFGREVFTGAIGYASPVAGLELSVAIRTFEAADGRIWLDAGGGIVADSDPAAELDECAAKARPLVEAIGSRIARRSVAAPPDATGSIPWALDGPGGRPDPDGGLLETIRVEGGRPVLADRHLARLEGSLQALYGTALPGHAAERLDQVAALVEDGAIRATAAGDGTFEVTAREMPERELPVDLAPFVLPGGLGPHKWADRRLVDRLAASGPTPLLVDTDGTVLEASWGNVWILEAGSLLTPPADGRILPGVSRQAIVDAGSWDGVPAREERFGLDRLAGADAVMVSSSLAGLVPARLTGEGRVGRQFSGGVTTARSDR